MTKRSKKEWRAIAEFPGYQVNRSGDVRSWNPRKPGGRRPLFPRYLKPARNSAFGHLQVRFQKDGRQHAKLAHRLVLEAFVGPCPDGMVACHNNGVPDDNRLKNLRWDTQAGNLADREAHGTVPRGADAGSKLTEDDVVDILASIDNHAQAAAAHGISKQTVMLIRLGKRWKHVFDRWILSHAA